MPDLIRHPEAGAWIPACAGMTEETGWLYGTVHCSGANFPPRGLRDMKTIQHTHTLFSYDGPQVFEARDAIGEQYIAVAVEAQNGLDRYLVTSVVPERLCQFRAGRLDLRSLLAEAGTGEWYLTTPAAGLDQPLVLVPQLTSIEASGFLPDEGFVLHGASPNQGESGSQEPETKNDRYFRKIG